MSKNDLWNLIYKELFFTIYEKVIWPIWVVISVCLVLLHLYVNIWIFDWWAEGNVFLIINSVFGLLQLIINYFVTLELPIILLHIKFIRWVSLILGFIYNLIWLFFLIKGLDLIFAWEGDSMNPIDMVFAMAITCLTVANLPIVIINDTTVLKEFQIYMYHLANTKGGDYIYYSLGSRDFGDMEYEVEEAFDPEWWDHGSLKHFHI